jgi:hypothetical protein
MEWNTNWGLNLNIYKDYFESKRCMILLRSVKNIRPCLYSIAVKCQAMENTYSKKNSFIPPGNCVFIYIKSSIEVLKYS